MQLDSSLLPSSGHSGALQITAVQELEDWAATIALTVAGTVEPSCALAFCFGNFQFFGKRRVSEKSALS